MADHSYYAVLYVYDKDGSEKASMPCFTQEQVMERAARYEKVRVLMPGRPPFWLSLTKEEREKYPPPQAKDVPLEWMRDYGDSWNQVAEKSSLQPAAVSDEFYDIWRSIKKSRQW